MTVEPREHDCGGRAPGLVDLTLGTPEENLALDEALFRQSEADAANGLETAYLRFWESQRYFVVLGVSSRQHDDVEVERCQRDGIAVLRRVSGGGTVLQGPGCLNFTFVFPLAAWPEMRQIESSYDQIVGRTAAALDLRGACRQGSCDLALSELRGCFETRSAGPRRGEESRRGDRAESERDQAGAITVEGGRAQGGSDHRRSIRAGEARAGAATNAGRSQDGVLKQPLKFGGSAQKRSRHALVHQGTILHAFDLELIPRYLKEPEQKPRYRGDRRHLEFLTNIPLPPTDIRSRVASAWGARPVDPGWSPPALETFVERYVSPEWIGRF